MRSRLAAHAAFAPLVAMLSVGIGCSGEEPKKPQNVVLITLDTTRVDFLSAYGYTKETTPNLDALARQGTRFDLAISTSAVTPVSHASILTGLYNHQHGLRVLSAPSGFRLAPEIPTLATVLKQNGFHTLAVHSAFPVSAHFGLDEGFDIFESFDAPIRVTKTGREKHSWPVGKYQRRSDETTDLVLEHLGSIQVPFFVWVHYWDPHDRSRLPPDEFLSRKTSEYQVTDGAGGPVPENRRIYAAEIEYMDLQIGRLLDVLAATNRASDTMIIVVADHGQGLGDHGWANHRILYQEQIRLPLIIKVPDVDQAPVVDELVRAIDVFPTVLDYLGLHIDNEVTGHSLRALMEGGREPGRLALADQINGFDMNADLMEKRPLDDFLYCAMDRDWKLVYRPTNPDSSELYHLTEDPTERHNRWSDRPDEARRLLKVLARNEPWVIAPFTAENGAGDLEAVREALSALGYLDASGDRGSGLDWAWACPENLHRLRGDRRQGDCATPLVPVLPRPDDAP